MTLLPANHLPHHVGTPTNFHVSPRLRQGPPAMAQPVHWLAREAADDDRMGIAETAAARASRGGVGHHYIPSFYMPISDHSRKADQTAYYRRPCILVKQPNNWAGAGISTGDIVRAPAIDHASATLATQFMVLSVGRHGSGRSGGERGVKDDGAAELPSLFPVTCSGSSPTYGMFDKLVAAASCACDTIGARCAAAGQQQNNQSNRPLKQTSAR
uniref:Uncharacterized protein n=1 Tax=Oryza nivara TaxID=4536 RepID=A0A0E0GDV0_ORYNI